VVALAAAVVVFVWVLQAANGAAAVVQPR